ncbi:hypothetical protein FSPOR_8569 [Fusarium sporotrichioides]|uniref:C2H2-type domain-containing protein n=1 Tax=Fusarium sporotrichioides TaxID=5514 RepID=A0A395RTP2_FUSSP|nr:hypothetical protein FSPOR_8569 [Fusarium sporotrichioides]
MDNQYYLPLAQNFLFNSSPDFPFTPASSPRSARNESGPWALNDVYHNMSYWINTQCPSSAFMSGAIGCETGGLPQHNAMHQEFAYMDYQLMSDASTVNNAPTSPVKLPSTTGECRGNYFDMSPAGSFMVSSPESRSRSGSIAPMSSLSCSSPSTMASERRFSDTPNSHDTDHYPLNDYSPRDSNSIYWMESPPKIETPRKMHKSSEETTVSFQPIHRGSSEEQAGVLATQTVIIRKATGQCDYPGCKKAFRRVEHLKRHKQSHHGEGGQNKFSCEFCGKDNFNRYDNLQIHRRLHARKNKRYRSVKFVPAAVPIIEDEEQVRTRKSRFTATSLKSQAYIFHEPNHCPPS